MRKYYIISIIGIIIFAILITIGVSIYKNTNSNLQQQGEAKNVVEKNEMQNNLVNSNIELVTTASE